MGIQVIVRIYFRLLPLLLAGLLLACAAPSRAQALRLAVPSDSKPFSWRDESGELKGLNVDLARLLCAVAGLSCRLEEAPFAAALSRLASGELDVLIGSLAETEQRRRQMLFTRPYLRGPSFWVGKSGTEDTPSLKVAAIQGSVQWDYVQEQRDARRWLPVAAPTWRTLLEVLQEGRADAAVVSFGAALGVLDNRRLLIGGFTLVPLKDERLRPAARIGVSLIRGAALVEKLNAALDAVEKDGRLDALMTRHLPFRIN